MGNVAKYQHGWNMTFTVVELLMIIPKSTYLSISLPYFSIYHFFSLTLFTNCNNFVFMIIPWVNHLSFFRFWGWFGLF